MPASLLSDAVLLRSAPYREADLVVTLFSRERGRLSALARGARRSQRRFAGALGLLVLGNAELVERPRAELWILQSFTIVRDYRALGSDVAALAHASYGTELVRELSAAEQADPAVLDLLLALYEALLHTAPSAALLRAFELRLLDAVGLEPALDRCAACGSEEPDRLDGPGAVFDPGRGGVLCASCARERAPVGHVRPPPAGGLPGIGTGRRALSAAARRELLRLRTLPALVDAVAAPPPPELAGEVRDTLLADVLAHVGKPLRSLEFILKMSGRRG